MKLRSLVVVLTLALAAAVSAGRVHTFFQEPSTSEQPVAAADETVTAWFVELQGAPIADGGSAADLAREKQAFRAAARAAGVTLRERFAYDRLFNGFSVEVSAEQLPRLARLTQVKGLFPVVSMARPETTEGEQPELSTAVTMTQVDIARNDLGLTGQGVRVAIMDTGVDYDHPDLGGCFGPGCRVEVGWDFVGDAYNNDSSSPTYNPVPVPDALPDDCNGHGTHVAGITGASGLITGVAPGVTFGAYRVFGCDGSTSADIMVAAMERILQDGAAVLNMSIGSSFQWPKYPTAEAATRLVNKGVVVVASAGNSGANGTWASSAPSVGQKVISVASFVNLTTKSPVFTISPDDRKVGYNNATGAAPTPFAGSYPMARTGTPASVNDACNAVAPAPGSLAGKVALIRRGTCGFHEKTVNAQNAGAIGVVIYNNVAGTISPTVVGATPITIPVVAITAADGVVIDGRIASGGVTMTWTAGVIEAPAAGAGLIAASSSYGMSPDLTLKPDIGAPGGSIRSTYPLERNGYASLSGTSMSAPHVAGAVALLLEARPKTTSQAVRSILQNSASPRVWSGNPGLGFLDMTHRQGAGMLQIADAVRSAVMIEPGKLSLGEFEAGATAAVHTLQVSNGGADAVTYQVGHAPGLATNGTNTLSFFSAPADVALSANMVVVPAGGTASVQVAVTPNPGLPDRSQYGGWIVFTPEGDGAVLRVPYAGFKGDYQSIQVLTPTASNYPWLAARVGTTYFNQPGGATYSMVGTDIPYFLAHLDHQSRELRFEVFDAVSGKAWHRAYQQSYVGRNSTATSFFAFPWDGQTVDGKKTYTVPNGQYVVRMTVIKALGDSSNPAHVETWTSPAITIARP